MRDLDSKYLVTMLEYMKKYSYGKESFKYNHINASRKKDGSLDTVNRHRAVCLLYLGRDEIKVIVTN